MVTLGTITTQKELRRKFGGNNIGKGTNGNKLIYHACIYCGKQRWVPLIRGIPQHLKCHSCAARENFQSYNSLGLKNAKWKGGRWLDKDGYVHVKLEEADFFANMANHSGYILEHRLIMARHLNRHLQPWEYIHHKNGVKNDNNLGNLELTIAHTHMSDHNKGYQDGFLKGYRDGQKRARMEAAKLLQ